MSSKKRLIALALVVGAMPLHEAAAQGTEAYSTSGQAGAIWKNPFGLCWRTGYWTPAQANPECDPELVSKPKPMAAPAPAPTPAPAPMAKPAPAPAPVAKPVPPPAPKKPAVIALKDTALFAFNSAALTPAGRSELDKEVLAKLKDFGTIRYINVNGHTDRLGSPQYNQQLSEKRAEAVKAYLVSKGVERDKVETYGFGKTLPIKACPDQKDRKALIECLAPNRRVEIEISGTPR